MHVNQNLLLLYVCSSSSDIVQNPTRVSRTVCVWLNVSTTPGNRCIYVQKWLFTGCWIDLNIGCEAGRAIPYKGVDALCFCNIIWEGVPQACAIREESALVCQIPRVWYAELGIAGPSACRCLYDVVRCQDVNKTMNYSVHHGDTGIRAAFR